MTVTRPAARHPDVLLINPPYMTLTSTRGVGHQVPLGLLMVGGALLQAGHKVALLDAEARRLPIDAILEEIRIRNPRIVMTGHAGSTPAHPTCMAMLRAIKRDFPHITTVYGGVYPTYHAAEILAAEAAVDIIVRGEGEATAVGLVGTLLRESPLDAVAGLAIRDGHGRPLLTAEREPLDMDDYPIGWTLIEDWDAYRCFGLGRAVIVQFSRGCPHQCTYCGQHGFWMKWRHRDPVGLAAEIQRLYEFHDVRFVTLADENPTTLKGEWRRFLEQMAARKLPVKFFATIRATDIVRDADILHLYREAGFLYILMGIETTDPETLRQIRKGSTTRIDYRACQLLKRHGIFSIIGHIVGLGEERWRDFVQAARQLGVYDGDYLNAMYVTPHSWTAFAAEHAGRAVIETEPAHWDYRHQVLGQKHMRAWELFLAVKLLELQFHLRPRRLLRMLAADRLHRQQFFWGLTHTGLVWVGEILSYLAHGRSRGGTRTLAEWYGHNVGAQRHAPRLVELRILRKRSGRELVNA